MMSQQGSNAKGVYTYIAIPVDVLKSNVEQNIESFTIAPNLLLKGFSSDSQEILPVTVNEDVLNSLSKDNNADLDKNSFVRILNLSPKTEEKLATILQNSVKKGSVDKDIHISTGLTKSIIFNSEENVVGTNDKSLSTKDSDSSFKNTQFKCAICTEVFNKRSTWRKHMQDHLESKKFKCDQCSASYNLENNLKLHMAIHTKGEPICPICHRKFLRLASLKSHLMNHHVEEIFTCSECLTEFEHERDLVIHAETHHQKEKSKVQEEYPLTCTFCSHTFDQSADYKEHVLHHIKMKQLITNGKRQKKRLTKPTINRHLCYVCKKSFSKYCFLERHVRIHTGEKPYACHLCKSAFNQKGTLQIHLLRHTGTKSFKCTLCSAKFFQKSNLRAHVQKTHTVPGPNEKVFKCTLCTCIFKRISSLSSHVTKMHVGEQQSHGIFSEVMEQLRDLQSQIRIESTEQSNTEYVGSREHDIIQNVGFTEHLTAINTLLVPESELNTDNSYGTVRNVRLADTSCEDIIKVHSVKQRKVGPYFFYTCTYCFKEFKKPSDLIRHIRVHTKEKPFKCEHCNQAFTVKSTLTNHLSTHYRSKSFQCVICSKTFTTLKILNVHLKKHDKIVTKNGNKYTCNICKSTFETIHEVKLHIVEHNINNRQRREEIPNKPAGIEVIMQQPLIETPEGLFPVPVPNSAINYTEEELLKRKYKCNECKSAFLKQIHLKRHMLIHSQDRKYRCPSCPKSFYSSYALKEHMKFHSGQRNYECIQCRKKFITSGILKRHMIVHTVCKPYVCPYCKMHFKTAAFCRKHINVHKKDINLEVHAMNETGEIDELFNNQLDVQEPISDDVYLLNDESNALQNIVLENVSSNAELTNELESCGVTTKVLFTDENGIIVSTAVDADEMLETHPSYIENGYATDMLLREEDIHEKDVGSLINTQSFIQQNGEDVYPTIYINCEGLSSLSPSPLYSTHFTQKIADPMFLSDGIGAADNILFTTNNNITTVSAAYLENQNSEECNDGQLSYSGNMEIPKDSTFSGSIHLESIDCLTSNTKFSTSEKQGVIIENQRQSKFDKALELIQQNTPAHRNKSVIEEVVETVGLTNIPSNLIMPEKNCIVCTQCREPFSIMEDLATHNCQVYNEGMKNIPEETEDLYKNFKCNFCNKTFDTQSIYKEHLLIHKKKLPSNKTCTYCQRYFKKQCDLVRHIRIHTGEKPYKCEKCEKCFSLKSTLNCHYRTHNPDSKKEFICLVCGASFSFRSSLKVHSRIHTGSRPFQCLLCPETFRTSGNRKTHMAVHSKSENVKKVSKSRRTNITNILASVAMETQNYNQSEDLLSEVIAGDEMMSSHEEESLQFVTSAADKDVIISIPNHSGAGTEPLLLHLNSVLLQTGIEELPSLVQIDILNDEGTPSTEAVVDMFSKNNSKITKASIKENESNRTDRTISKSYECDICHKTYSRKDVLTKHKKTHILKCTPCNVYFDTQESHANHVKLHNTCRSYSCHLCANTFHFEKNLKAHLKRIHNVIIV